MGGQLWRGRDKLSRVARLRRGVCFDTFRKYTPLNHIYGYWERLKNNRATYTGGRSINKMVRAHINTRQTISANKRKTKRKKQEKKQKNKKRKKRKKNIFYSKNRKGYILKKKEG